MKKVVIFDVDGTLCDTCDVDDECFRRACGEALGADVQGLDWSSAPHVTDEGILQWLWVQHHGRPPFTHEVDAVKARFVGLLKAQLTRSPGRFSATMGALEALARLRDKGWTIGIATGGWAVSARLKLDAAGMSAEPLLATSDDSPCRVEVFRMAVERLTPEAGGIPNVVLVGDGVWDVRVAHELGWSFAGVASSGSKAMRLRQAGAPVVMENFGDLDALERILTASERPSIAPGRGTGYLTHTVGGPGWPA